MLSYEMEKMLTLTNERRAALIKEATAARLIDQQEKTRESGDTWSQILRRWWRRMTLVRPVYQRTRHSLVES